MRIFKRIIALALLCSALLSAVSCGEFHPATNTGGSGGGGGNSGSGGNKFPDGSADQPGLDDDPSNDFSVQLKLNGQPFSPTTSMNVYWSDGYNVHIAPVDESGYAVIDGLDGDYSVTLSSVPSGCAYDPNSYTATNENKNIIIDLYDLNHLRGAGAGLYECYYISTTGVYTVTVNGEEDFNYIEFAPQHNGIYTVESWVSVAEDEISPICIGYLGSSQYKYGEYRVTDVGIIGSYTRNFIHSVTIADENISSGGSQTFTFAVGAETKSGVYPVNLTFAIKRNGDFDIEREERVTVLPDHDWRDFDFDGFNALAGGNIVGAETLYQGTTDTMVFEEDNYRVWSTSEGGDGVYHVYDPEKYPETDGYGPILVAYITEPCRFLGESFTHIEDAGNNALVIHGIRNYRLFIKGFSAVAAAGYFCATNCPCHFDGSPLACLAGCPDCTKDCRPATSAEMEVKGYAEYANSDGVVPVTPELKEFLQSFSSANGYFSDGEGWVETNPYISVNAYEDSQWLFACGYYE